MEDPKSYGPAGVVGQLQLTFDGVTPLSLEERISDWLALQDEETADVLTATLFLTDNESRRRRASRWYQLRCIQAPYHRESGWLISGGAEVAWLYDESCRDYIDGAYFSTLLCAHAACERVLAGLLSFHREELESDWLRWGLGRLISAARQRRIVDETILDDLRKLSEIRKVSAHFKPFLDTPTSVLRRANDVLESYPDLDDEEAIDNIVRSDALFAIQIATVMVLSNLGFG
jgi:hypothetical protein